MGYEEVEGLGRRRPADPDAASPRAHGGGASRIEPVEGREEAREEVTRFGGGSWSVGRWFDE